MLESGQAPPQDSRSEAGHGDSFGDDVCQIRARTSGEGPQEAICCSWIVGEIFRVLHFERGEQDIGSNNSTPEEHRCLAICHASFQGHPELVDPSESS